ncbi:MAG: hypothetical protein AAF086_01110 [Planctomycetota bacterium]
MNSLKFVNRLALGFAAVVSVAVASQGRAATTVISPNVYRIDAGVTLNLGNQGASNYLFNWTDSSGTFTNISDPTLELVAGQTYTFQRISGSHPFVITDDTLPVTGSDGSFSRATSSGTVIDAATLTPIADFTANPAPTTDQIIWTPTLSDLGDYFYTCRVTGHVGMTGAIRVIPEPASGMLILVGTAVLGCVRRRQSGR